MPEHAAPWPPQPTGGLRGVQEPQGILVAHVGPLAEQGVDVGQAGPLPAGRASQQHGQRAGRRMAVVALLPQSLAVGVHQPTAAEGMGGTAQARGKGGDGMDGMGLAGWGRGTPSLHCTPSSKGQPGPEHPCTGVTELLQGWPWLSPCPGTPNPAGLAVHPGHFVRSVSTVLCSRSWRSCRHLILPFTASARGLWLAQPCWAG